MSSPAEQASDAVNEQPSTVVDVGEPGGSL